MHNILITHWGDAKELKYSSSSSEDRKCPFHQLVASFDSFSLWIDKGFKFTI